MTQIAILGWGSLLWENNEKQCTFEEWLRARDWNFDGPTIPLEFSRISTSRKNALTLVIDHENGQPTRVAWQYSKRKDPEEARADLRCREGSPTSAIGIIYKDDANKDKLNEKNKKSKTSADTIRQWAKEKNIDAVIWTDLENNFTSKNKDNHAFSIPNAIQHIQKLDAEGKAKAAEYIWRAPSFVQTALRDALQKEPWFKCL